MKLRLRFSLRTMLITMALIACTLVFVPWAIHRMRVNSALDSILANGLDWRPHLLSGSPDMLESVELLVSDRNRVLPTLLDTVLDANEPSWRRTNALNTMSAIVFRTSCYPFCKKSLPKLVELAVSGATTEPLERELAKSIAAWTPSLGVSQEQRKAMLKRITELSAETDARGETLVAWIDVLVALGGRNEMDLLLELGTTRPEDIVGAICTTSLISSTWPGLLPSIKDWLKDPQVARECIDFTILSQTPEGRRLLLEYVLNDANPPGLQTYALEQLAGSFDGVYPSGTLAGAELVAAACEDEDVSRKLSKLVGRDANAYVANALKKAASHNGDDFWVSLVEGLNPVYSFDEYESFYTDEQKADYLEYRKAQAPYRLKCLQVLTGADDLKTYEQWQSWYETVKPNPVSQRRILQLVVDYPKLAGLSEIFSSLGCYYLGYLPDDCLPLYRNLMQASEPGLRYHACQAVLTFSQDEVALAEAIDAAIDLIEYHSPSNRAVGSLNEVGLAYELLRNRFAVNFFWDVDAWRVWARQRKASP